ncbi:heterogeneous nuclear ribonucleoprotein L [Trichuris trichiura]|uniref:Heterogeneous nuclear ribonucleoprotein L n=1 Tax=Trichuris trichiura TaxID=36087 RepID=A0A077YVS5_TRITR|nr:heterogeneous nuclear ribonucleoprotein L [Trichuris trichiura]
MQFANLCQLLGPLQMQDNGGEPYETDRRSIERGPGDVLPICNGTSSSSLSAMSPQQTDGSSHPDSDAKKAKLDEVILFTQETGGGVGDSASDNGISRVVHLRNVPSEVTELELMQNFIHFGNIEKVLLLKSKNQGFLQFENEECAEQLVTRSANSPVQIRGKTIFCQYSNYQTLVTGSRYYYLPNGLTNEDANIQPLDVGMNGSGGGGGSGSGGGSNSVLRVIIENQSLIYPISLDCLHQIFSRYGIVLRIVTFRKNQAFQALVQFADCASAQAAKMALDGNSLFNGYCTLRVEYSRMATLNVKYNNEKSRDFTNPNLPSGDFATDAALDLASVLNATSAISQIHGNLTSPITTVGSPFAAAFSPANALQVAGAGFPATALNLPTLSLATATNNALAGMASLRLPAQFPPIAVSSVLLVSNLNEDNCYVGVYGDVQRVKILFNKKNSALVQYSEPTQAQLAQHHLDKVTLWNRTIRVSYSKHLTVQLPKEGQPDAGLTKDYSLSLLHRFKKPGSKNYLNIYPPSASLHLSNIPASTTEDFIVNAFVANGFVVKSFKFFPKDHKMAIIQLESTEQGIEALVAMHNLQLSENAHLRVSFSKPSV